MLSKRAEKLLRWIDKQKTATKIMDIEGKCKSFDRPALKALKQMDFVCYQFDENFESWDYCRITDAGKAYLRELTRQRWKRILECLTLGVSIAALFGVDAIAAEACKLWEIIRALLS